MEAAVSDDEKRRFTADEVLRMVEAGVLGEDEHLELLDGELLVMSPQGAQHRALTIELRDRLAAAYGDGFHVQDHSTLRTDDWNLPEPDVAVVRGAARDYLDRLPSGQDIALVVELAQTSRARDRRKAGIYAAAGIPRYWLVDLPKRRVEVHRRPGPEGYADSQVLQEDDALELPGLQERWSVRSLLP